MLEHPYCWYGRTNTPATPESVVKKWMSFVFSLRPLLLNMPRIVVPSSGKCIVYHTRTHFTLPTVLLRTCDQHWDPTKDISARSCGWSVQWGSISVAAVNATIASILSRCPPSNTAGHDAFELRLGFSCTASMVSNGTTNVPAVHNRQMNTDMHSPHRWLWWSWWWSSDSQQLPARLVYMHWGQTDRRITVSCLYHRCGAVASRVVIQIKLLRVLQLLELLLLLRPPTLRIRYSAFLFFFVNVCVRVHT